MKKLSKVILAVAFAAVFVAAGYGIASYLNSQGGHHALSLEDGGKLFAVSEACAHTGGACYLDDTNISTVEGGCYAKCKRGYKVGSAENFACEVGCSEAISVAMKRH